MTMGQIVTYLLMIQKFTNLKDYEILVGPICLGNISKVWSVDNNEKNWIYW